jgi:hypothetical protein
MSFRAKASRVAGGLFVLVALGLLACDPAPAETEAASATAPLTQTFDSPETLARTVLQAFATEDVRTLKSLPLSREEFRSYVWPRLPASRPERGIPFDYGWGDLHQKSVSAIASNYARYKGRKLELVSIGFKEGRTDYGTFVVHRDSELQVRDVETGEELALALFGSVLEYQGKYKIFSYVTD